MNLEVFEYLQDAVVALDESQQIIYCNSAFSSLVGLASRRLVNKGKQLAEVMSCQDQFFESAKSQDSVSDVKLRESEFEIKQSSKVVSLQYVFQYVDANYLIFFRDVSLEKSLNEKYRMQLSQKEVVIDELKVAQGELKVYSEKLEVLVQDRTRDLNEALARQTATMDSLSQGVMIIDSQGYIRPPFSKSAQKILNVELTGQEFSKVLNLSADSTRLFEEWMFTTFMDALPFEDMKDLCPVREMNYLNQNLEIDFYPLRTNEGFSQLVVLVTDKSKEVQMAATLEHERQFAQSLVHVLRYPTAFKKFLKGSQEMLSRLKRHLSRPQINESEEVLRDLHTLKGGASSFGLAEVSRLAHQAETHVESKEWRAAKELTIKIKDEVETFCAKISEFLDLSDVNSFSLKEVIQSFKLEIDRLSKLLNKFDVNFIVEGENLQLPESYLSLVQNLIHCVRNSMDHGYTDLREREQLGKTDFSIKLTWALKGERLELCFSDNGKGMNVTKLREKLSSQNPFHSVLSDRDVIKYVLKGGLSSRDEVSETSGRGVGVGALFQEVTKLKGTLDLTSELGQGTSIKISIPVKLAENLKAA